LNGDNGSCFVFPTTPSLTKSRTSNTTWLFLTTSSLSIPEEANRASHSDGSPENPVVVLKST